MTHSDQELMERLRDRDEEAFDTLLARYREAVDRHLAATVRDGAAAEDLLQEVFLRLWTRAEQWDGRGALKPWLFRIATNLALNHLRTVQRRREQPLEIAVDATADGTVGCVPGWMIDTTSPSPEAVLEQAERQAQQRLLIDGLPDEKRAVFRLVHEEEMPLQDVADALGIPEGTVKSRLHYARKRLARAWGEGRSELAGLAGIDVAGPDGLVTKASLIQALRTLLDRDGVAAALAAADRLMRRGFEAVRESGASMSPFLGASVARPPAPTGSDADTWDAYNEELSEHVAARTDYLDHDIGPQLLAVKSGARATIRQLVCLTGSRGTVTDVHGRPLPIRHGWREGLTPDEMFAVAVATRKALARWHQEWRLMRDEVRPDSLPRGFHVLARAMRARRPGIVFAHAAATGEVDPLTDLDSRLFAGLPARDVTKD